MTQHPGPPDQELELAELRGRLRGRWKAERRDQEREALHEHWQQRDLIDAVIESMHRGDEVAFHFPAPRTLRGYILSVGRDYATLREAAAPHREYAIRLPRRGLAADSDAYSAPHVAFEVLRRASHVWGENPEIMCPTFQAVLQEFDFTQQAAPHRLAELATTFHVEPWLGTFQAHTGDHVYLRSRDGRELFIPASTIASVAWARSEM